MGIDEHPGSRLLDALVTGQMKLAYPRGRNGGEVLAPAEAMVAGGDEDVVEVEQDTAAGFLGHRRDEFPFLEG